MNLFAGTVESGLTSVWLEKMKVNVILSRF